MRIGIDFDNTLVNYDLLFKSIANKLGLLGRENSKESVKRYFTETKGNIQLWKETQGLVYGIMIGDANFLPDFIDFFNYLKCQNIDIYIISYKTKYASYNGAKVSLHLAANKWIDKNLNFFERRNIYFETTVTKKIRRIKSLDLDYYIDDLLTILYHRDFPKGVKKVLFAGDKNSLTKKKNLPVISTWNEAIEIIKAK